MKGETHHQFALGFGYVMAILLDRYYNIGLNFYLLALIMPLLVSKGTKFPDYDQPWDGGISEKTTFSWFVNRFIKLTGGSHRSKHTHSWDVMIVTLIGLWFGVEMLHSHEIFSELDRGIAFVILFGFYSGWASHLISDMFNGTGVWPTVFAKKKVAFVPRRMFGIQFKTGGAWEAFFCKMCVITNHILEVIVIMYPIVKNGLLSQLFDYIAL